MSIKVRETRGTSWKGTAPGIRHWHSTSVSYGLGAYALRSIAACLTRGIWGLFLLPFVVTWWMLMAVLWIYAELALFTVTGLLAIGAVAHREARAADLTVTRGRWGLFMFGLKGAGR